MNKWAIVGVLTSLLIQPSYAKQVITEQRQQLFEHIENNVELLEDRVDEGDWPQVANLALKLEQDVIQLKKLFPKSSKGEGRSKNKIWQDWKNFDYRLTQWSLSFKHLATVSETENGQRIENALDTATSACRSCHMKYRSLW